MSAVNSASIRGPRLVLLPLDERPVNIQLPSDVAAIAGATLDVPPREMLPDLRKAGRTEELAHWLDSSSKHADALVVSTDMLCYGGLIAARTSSDATPIVLSRLDGLRSIRERNPALPLAAVSLVMRASDSYSAQEEPDYWATHGRELHKLGAMHHRTFVGDTAADVAALEALVTAEIRLDFERRRLRNHLVNLHALSLVADGVIDPLLITADDTAEFAAGTMEQLWIAQWNRILPISGQVLMYPGADEVGAVLVARELARLIGHTARFKVECVEPAGLDRIPNYENGPLRVAIDRQVRAAGASLVHDEDAMALLIHAPDIDRRDLCGHVPQFDDGDRAESERTADLAARLLEKGRDVALADLRYSNGGDPLLIEALRERGVLTRLTAYGGWNTAGNALGSVVAAAAAVQVSRQAGVYNEAAAKRLLLHRLIEDWGYQAVVRGDYGAGLQTFDAASEGQAAQEVARELNLLLTAIEPNASIGDVRFPWHRSFEISFAVEAAA
jgi:hypothetical protein